MSKNPSGSRLSNQLIPEGLLTQKRLKVFKSIFDFYCRQHMMGGKKITFEQIGQNLQLMSMGDFLKFCSDFRLLEDYDELKIQNIK